MTTTRSLAVPPQPHGPLTQPAGAALRLCPPPAAPSRSTRARVVIAEARAWIGRCRADGYFLDALRLERQVVALERAMGREPIEPVDARIRRLGGGR